MTPSTTTANSFNLFCVATVAAFMLLAWLIGPGAALIACLGVVVTLPDLWFSGAATWCSERITIDEHTPLPHDQPLCPRCQASVAEDQCQLLPYVGNRIDADDALEMAAAERPPRRTYTLAGYFCCKTCDCHWAGMERGIIAPSPLHEGGLYRQYNYAAWPHFAPSSPSLYNTVRACEPAEYANSDARGYLAEYVLSSTPCSKCRAAPPVRRHTLVERSLCIGPLRLLRNCLSIDECLNPECRQRQWVSRLALF